MLSLTNPKLCHFDRTLSEAEGAVEKPPYSLSSDHPQIRQGFTPCGMLSRMPNPTPKSWLPSANTPHCDFPLQNLPYCAFRTEGMHPHIGIGIGDSILDLNKLSRTGLFRKLGWDIRSACRSNTLNSLIELGTGPASLLRETLTHLLSTSATPAQVDKVKPTLRPIEGAVFCKPVSIGDYSDFYASIDHATNVGKLFRPDEPLLPNYKYVPIGYHGRASSIRLSGEPIIRPSGQIKNRSSEAPEFCPTAQMDYELEVAAYVRGGRWIKINEAERYLFGISLLNDWSARDIQSWEYQPLGPFLGKSFATTISPWVVPMEALDPYRVPLAPRPTGDPTPLPYLTTTEPSAIDLHLEVFLTTQSMRGASLPPHQLSTANLRDLYWSFPQLIAHHTSNGCNLRPGDLLASGTISGPTEGTKGSLLEITQRGTTPLTLPNGETRTFLEDGDEIIFQGHCERPGLPRIGLGDCRGTVTVKKSL